MLKKASDVFSKTATIPSVCDFLMAVFLQKHFDAFFWDVLSLFELEHKHGCHITFTSSAPPVANFYWITIF